MASSIPNFLVSNRKRFSLGQDEVAFLLGVKNSDIPSRHETFSREPLLRTALAYEVIYQKPIRELFAGLYADIEKDVSDRANLLLENTPEANSDKRQLLAQIAELGAPNHLLQCNN
jgi:hypothetical protein